MHVAFLDSLDSALFSHNWYPDRGATNHATPDPTTASRLDSYSSGATLRVGNGASLETFGIGHATLPDSRSLHLPNELFVPGLSNSLLYV